MKRKDWEIENSWTKQKQRFLEVILDSRPYAGLWGSNCQQARHGPTTPPPPKLPLMERTDNYQASSTLNRKLNLRWQGRETGVTDVSTGGRDLAGKASQGCGDQSGNWRKIPFASGGGWGGLELLGCAEGPRPHDSSNRPRVSEDTQDEKGCHSQYMQSQHAVSEVTRAVLSGSSCGNLGEIREHYACVGIWA